MRRFFALPSALVTVVGLGLSAPALTGGAASAAARPGYTLPGNVAAACPASGPAGVESCAVLVRTDVSPGTGVLASAPPGYGPSSLQGAYGLQASSAGMRQTVAVVDAYDDPAAEADLGVYRQQYGLAPCTTANGCFRKVNETGGTSYPAASTGWGLEISADLDMVSAICPNCRLLLVEASSDSISDLGTAVNTAVKLGASFVTNPYAGPESAAETGDDSSYFDHPGVALTAAAGDGGYGVSYPAASPDVTSVGGTTLTQTGPGTRGWTETAWAGTGSGCSAYEPQPSWQSGLSTGCTTRADNDVAAVADPVGSPVAVYDSGYTTAGWLEAGGTAISADVIAGVYALASTPATGTNPASFPYAHATALNDITSGSDGGCPAAVPCTAGAGWDGPTGIGSPSFTAGFDNAGQQGGVVRSGLANRCLDDAGDSSSNDGKVDIYECNGTAAQNWAALANGTVRINGLCLDVKGQGTSNGTPVDIYSCNGGANQQWQVRPDGELVNPVSGKCLDDPGSTLTDGTQLDIDTCTGGANQAWVMPDATPVNIGPLTSGVSPARCADDYQGSTTPGNKVDLYTCTGGGPQAWTIESEGTIEVYGLCLDVKGAATASGSVVDLYTCNGQDNQQWRVLADGALLNPVSGLCLADPGDTTTLGTQLEIETCDQASDQDWPAVDVGPAAIAAGELQSYYDSGTGLFSTPSNWWQSAEELDVLIDYSEQTGATAYLSDISNTFAKAADEAPSPKGDFLDNYYDDDGWWALTWVNAYKLTHDTSYLTMAETMFTAITKGWDSVCGGGLYWNDLAGSGKNAIPNELFLSLAAQLYQITGTQSYLTWANEEWTWFKGTGLINSGNLVNDGLNSDCANNGATTWTYNQGVILGGLTDMYQITGTQSYLTQAEAIANAATSTLVTSGGILSEPCGSSGCDGDQEQFKGIFVRNLYALSQVAQQPSYPKFIAANAASIWASDRNAGNQLGLLWQGPAGTPDGATQGSALDALNAAIPAAGSS